MGSWQLSPPLKVLAKMVPKMGREFRIFIPFIFLIILISFTSFSTVCGQTLPNTTFEKPFVIYTIPGVYAKYRVTEDRLYLPKIVEDGSTRWFIERYNLTFDNLSKILIDAAEDILEKEGLAFADHLGIFPEIDSWVTWRIEKYDEEYIWVSLNYAYKIYLRVYKLPQDIPPTPLREYLIVNNSLEYLLKIDFRTNAVYSENGSFLGYWFLFFPRLFVPSESPYLWVKDALENCTSWSITYGESPPEVFYLNRSILFDEEYMEGYIRTLESLGASEWLISKVENLTGFIESHRVNRSLLPTIYCKLEDEFPVVAYAAGYQGMKFFESSITSGTHFPLSPGVVVDRTTGLTLTCTPSSLLIRLLHLNINTYLVLWETNLYEVLEQFSKNVTVVENQASTAIIQDLFIASCILYASSGVVFLVGVMWVRRL